MMSILRNDEATFDLERTKADSRGIAIVWPVPTSALQDGSQLEVLA